MAFVNQNNAIQNEKTTTKGKISCTKYDIFFLSSSQIWGKFEASCNASSRGELNHVTLKNSFSKDCLDPTSLAYKLKQKTRKGIKSFGKRRDVIINRSYIWKKKQFDNPLSSASKTSNKKKKDISRMRSNALQQIQISRNGESREKMKKKNEKTLMIELGPV